MFLRKCATAALGLIITSGIAVFAQQSQTGTSVQQPDRFQKRLRSGRMKHRSRAGFGLGQLNLTDQQEQQTRVILERYLESTRVQREELLKLREKRMADLFTADDGARARELHQQLRDSQQGFRTEIGSLLTPEQRAQLEQFESLRKVRQDEMLNRGRRFRRRDPIQ